MDPNSFEAIKSKLSPQTLKDIEGLDPAEFGFGRKECCGGVPPKLPGSLKLKEHVFLHTTMPATEWAPKSDNVENFTSLFGLVKAESPNASYNVCHLHGADPFILHVVDVRASAPASPVRITQYSLPDPLNVVPWKSSSGVLEVDRSKEYFVFVCAHLSRDARCGYCGAILVDLIRSCVAEKSVALSKTQQLPVVTVMPCSHVGGHIYAGNVIVYSRFGGVGYGLFRPQDVSALVDSLLADRGEIPPALSDRIRGHMGATYESLP